MNRQQVQFTANFILFVTLLLIIFAVTKPTGLFDILTPFFLLFAGSYFVYQFGPSDIKQKLIGVNFSQSKIFQALLWGGLFGGIFYLISKFFPGASIGLPIIPNSVSTQLRFFLIVFVAPIAEELFFRGAILGYLRSTKTGKRNVWFAIIGSALLFAFAHLGAYVSGIYAYPNFTQGLAAVQANLGSFFTAFLFGTVAAWFVSKDGIDNLLFSMVFHSILNLVIYTTALSVFVG